MCRPLSKGGRRCGKRRAGQPAARATTTDIDRDSQGAAR